MKKILILNGPNLNLLGKRDPEIYGYQNFETFFVLLKKDYPNLDLHHIQSNHEGVLIDRLQDLGYDIDGIVFNAGGYTHTSVALRDTISAITAPVVEVHISDIYSREPFRHHSYIKDVCVASIVGQGLDGYRQAIDLLLARPS